MKLSFDSGHNWSFELNILKELDIIIRMDGEIAKINPIFAL